MHMDIKKAPLEALLLILEIKRLGLKYRDNFENLWTEEAIYLAISEYYYQENHTKETKKEKLYQWLKQKARYTLLNKLLKMQVARFTNDGTLKDSFVLNNFESFLTIMMNIFQTLAVHNIFPTQLSTIDIKTTHQLVRDFLIEVDPSLEWLAIYNEMVQKNKLIIFNDLTKQEQKKVLEKTHGINNICIHSQTSPFIIVTLNETIEDVISIIHEFIHYLSFYKNPQANIVGTLSESSSIFYEYYALLFLENKGYSKEDIEMIRNDRLLNTRTLSFQIHNICSYLLKYLKNGEIKETQELQRVKQNMDHYSTTLPNDMKKWLRETNKDILDAAKRIHDSCDQCIEHMILYPEDLYQCYPYIIGNYLAIQGMEQIRLGHNILPKIKELTETLYSIDPIVFFESVGCDIEITNKQIKKEFYQNSSHLS